MMNKGMSRAVVCSALALASLAGANDPSLQFLSFGDDALRSGETVMNLVMLNDTDKTGAVCLDGTPGGFYFSPATNNANKDNWQIYFQGADGATMSSTAGDGPMATWAHLKAGQRRGLWAVFFLQTAKKIQTSAILIGFGWCTATGTRSAAIVMNLSM